MDIEKKNNEQIISKQKGQLFCYEDKFQLRHYISKYYLNSRNICSNTSAIGYVVELSKNFSESMILKILPKYKSF